MPKNEYLILSRTDEGTMFYAPYCRQNISTEYPDTELFGSFRAAMVKAKRLTSVEFWLGTAEVWENYGSADERMVAIVERGYVMERATDL